MENRFDVIDVHMHLGPYSQFHIAHNDAQGMIEEMDRLGIRQGWVAAHAAISADARRGNDESAEAVRAYPGRFQAYVVVDPNYPEEVLPELERRMAQPEFNMIKIHPSLAQYPIDGPNYAPVWDVAEEYACPVLTHAWSGDALCGPEPIRRVMQKHPEVNLLFGHALFPTTFEEAAKVALEFPNLWLDITSSNQSYRMIEHAVETVGAERILYGSDMPFLGAAGALGRILHAEISDEDKALILGGNAKRLLARR
jgi:predicted TIM-barrel fold metal-dependent hydrolase